MQTRNKTLRKFLMGRRLELFTTYRELKEKATNEPLDDYEELELNCIEVQLNLVQEVIKLCETRKRF